MDFHSTFIPALVAYAIKDDSFNMHKGKWMVEGTLSALLLNHYNIDKELSFTEDILVNALGQNNIINLRKHNLAGVHESSERNMSRLHAVDHRQKGQRRRRVYYIEMKPFVPRRSNRLKRVHDEVSNTLPAIVSPTPTKKTRRRSSQLQVTDLSHTSVSSIILFQSPRNHFRNVKTDLVVNSSDRVWFKELLQLHINTLEQIQGSNCTPIEIVDAELQNQMTDAKHKKIADRIREEVIQSISNGKYKAGGPSIYWYSTEAKNLFCPDADPDDSIYDLLKQRLEMFRNRHDFGNSWSALVEGKPDPKDLSHFSFERLNVKMACIEKVTELALENLGKGEKGQNFEYCCAEVVKWCSKFGNPRYPTNAEVVRRWHAEFRTHGVILVRQVPSKIPSMPRFLIDNVDKAIAIRNFVKTNIDGISVEHVHTYIMENIFPSVADNFVDPCWEGNEDEEVRIQITIEDLFKHYNLKNFSHSTAYRWMIALGMRYCDRRKNYYVDGHEREDVVEARWRFVRNYLRDELQMHRWIQLSEDEIVAICGDKFDKDMLATGFKYEDPVSRRRSR
ncbi:hypothetical protein CTEN210_04334 [Chaetoceros tenuissimus]|uniref:Uncharacterized protein n=2 Tax=Chaetoceros tenuissimus TaxID=426638 RepID=A0AAD3CL08_9STRA|nr:hypothetical protein CTEN210_04334 [Chaetoceros tenuissimus]